MAASARRRRSQCRRCTTARQRHACVPWHRTEDRQCAPGRLGATGHTACRARARCHPRRGSLLCPTGALITPVVVVLILALLLYLIAGSRSLRSVCSSRRCTVCGRRTGSSFLAGGVRERIQFTPALERQLLETMARMR